MSWRQTGRRNPEAGRGTKRQGLERLRDECLIAIMQALRQFEIGAGKTLAENEARRSGEG